MTDNRFDILFVCGSLKPGADGIGDYSRRLGTQLIRMGYTVRLLAFNDKSIDSVLTEIQSSDEVQIETLRLPKSMSFKHKVSEIKNWMNGQSPDFVSIQYVLYAYNKRGLPFLFASQMKFLFRESKFHIMFHELWLGMELHPDLKDKFYGAFQRFIIRKMVGQLRPVMVHTHSRTYLNILKLNGIQAQHLPIISNIPVAQDIDKYKATQSIGNMVFMIFGYICPHAPILDFARELSEFSMRNEKNVAVVIAGKNGENLPEWEAAFKRYHIPYVVKGILSAEEISKLMNDCDIGISTTPFSLYEKSGSVAAMFKHGLPVINVAESIVWSTGQITDYKVEEPIAEYVPGMLEAWIRQLQKPGRKEMLSKVAEKFISDLNIKDISN